MIATSPLLIAQRFMGLKEMAGTASNPLILGMLQLDTKWVQADQTPWCSAFVNFVFFLLGLPRSRSLAARSWLLVGLSVPLSEAQPGHDVVILQRGTGTQPPATVIAAPGHVGLYVGHDATTVTLLGGNQGDSVNVQSFPKSRILGIRRIT